MTQRKDRPQTVGVRLRPDVIHVLPERARRGHRSLAAECRKAILEDLESSQEAA